MIFYKQILKKMEKKENNTEEVDVQEKNSMYLKKEKIEEKKVDVENENEKKVDVEEKKVDVEGKKVDVEEKKLDVEKEKMNVEKEKMNVEEKKENTEEIIKNKYIIGFISLVLSKLNSTDTFNENNNNRCFNDKGLEVLLFFCYHNFEKIKENFEYSNYDMIIEKMDNFEYKDISEIEYTNSKKENVTLKSQTNKSLEKCSSKNFIYHSIISKL
jgi:hypothetical protein